MITNDDDDNEINAMITNDDDNNEIKAMLVTNQEVLASLQV